MTGQAKQGHAFILSMLASLFFIWGFLSVMQDTLVPHLKSVFDLNYTQSLLVSCTWFVTYFIMSLPCAFLLQRIGYKKCLVTGLIVMAVGCLLLLPAAEIAFYPLFLFALFVTASGITLLQVAANPYVAVIGSPQTASARLNLVQAMNTVGDTVAPMFGALLILGRSKGGTATAGTVLTQAEKLADARSVELPYLGIAAVLILLAVLFTFLKLPDLGNATKRLAKEERKKLSLWKQRNLVFGVPAIFMYLICEIGVGSLFINFVKQPEIGNMPAADAAHYLTYLWGGMAVGRFVGAWLMTFIEAETVLAGAAVGAFGLLLAVVFSTGTVAMWALIAVGLFHSIMFPTIFTLGIKGLGALTEEGSGLLIMAIAGGALADAQGWIADRHGLQISFLLPAVCELYCLFYALWGCRVTNPEPPETLESS
ncbi:MAG: sugar MFS transporter [Alphaproteobacteria bacterium]|nr:sugar MFS transporter [Alphaproteobacteria bacterium]